MPLSEHEQKLLEQLEQQLNADDPYFASSMSASSKQESSAYTVRHLVFGVLIVLVGLAVVIAGVASKLTLIGVLGFVIAGAGVYVATLRNASGASTSNSKRATPQSTKKPNKFMQNLENRWDERRSQGF